MLDSEVPAAGQHRRIRLQIEGIVAIFDVPSIAPVTPDARVAHGALPMAFGDWLFFSPAEERIVRLLLDHDALSREQIAAKLDESETGRIRGLLACLVARRVLAAGADGYRLNTDAAKRAELRAWFDDRDTSGGEPGGSADADDCT
jgi:hypothetical protein